MVGLIDTFGVGMVKNYRGEKVRESITRLLNFSLKIHAESRGPWITSPFHITTSAIVVPSFSLINSFALWTEKKKKVDIVCSHEHRKVVKDVYETWLPNLENNVEDIYETRAWPPNLENDVTHRASSCFFWPRPEHKASSMVKLKINLNWWGPYNQNDVLVELLKYLDFSS